MTRAMSIPAIIERIAQIDQLVSPKPPAAAAPGPAAAASAPASFSSALSQGIGQGPSIASLIGGQTGSGKTSSADALLIAFMEDRPIYVFDEWAADQDVHYREIFYRELLPELQARGKTVLVISHDDRYYHLGDRVVKLDYGRIAG